MRKLLFILLLTTVGSMLTKAQSFHTSNLPEAKERAKMQTEFMKDKLSLSEEQCQKVYEINLNCAKQLGTIDKNVANIKKFKVLRSINKEKKKALKAILNEEQYKLYKTLEKDLKKQFKEARKKKSKK